MNKSNHSDRLSIKFHKENDKFPLDSLAVKTAMHQVFEAIFTAKPRDSHQAMSHWVFMSNHSKKWQGTLAHNEALSNAAVQKFFSDENIVKETNQRLTGPIPAWARDCISQASWTIHKVLGHTLSISEWAEACTQSGGAAFELPRRLSSVQAKYGRLTGLNITSSALPYYKLITKGSLLERGSESFTIIPGSRLTTVPKNNETDRPINIEPSCNMFLQKGLGNLIRDKIRMARLGSNTAPIYDRYRNVIESAGVASPKSYIDLNDQARNQMLALLASDLDLCTIDLASASDSISIELCRLLLPREWYAAIMDVRSPLIQDKSGSWTPLEKISSMGNGFTFELESLIFYALCDACVKLTNDRSHNTLGVYGDDIICHITHVDSIVDLLSFCGFTTNSDKSFIGGKFHESCGIYSYDSRCVTPPNIRFYPTTVTELILTINKLLRWYKRTYGWYNHHSDMVFPLLKLVPRNLRKRYIPDGYGDGAIISDAYDVRKSSHYADGIYWQRVLVPVSRPKKANWRGAIIACLKEGGFWSEHSCSNPTTVAFKTIAVVPLP